MERIRVWVDESSNLRYFTIPRAKWYVLIWFKYLIPLTCLEQHCTLMIISIIDWLDTHQIKPTSNYYNGHLDTKNHENVMNCTYYIVFEQNYKNIQWWKSKKERMENKTEEQTKVNIWFEDLFLLGLFFKMNHFV